MKKKTSQQTPADKAFTGSDKHTLDDLKLDPWTPERIIKAQELGMLYPNLGKGGRAQLLRTAVYPGAVRDVILFVYLSTLEPQDVDDATWVDARAFGVKRGLHNRDSSNTSFWEAYEKFTEIQNEIQASFTVPKSDGTEDPPEDDDDPKD